MRARGLGDPLLVVSDGAPGIIKVIETCFPCSARQHFLAHRMRYLAAKVPEDLWPEFKVHAQAAYQAPSRAIAPELAADYANDLLSAAACFEDDLEACIAQLRMPTTHRRAMRTTNLLERLFIEERRRLQIIPNAFAESFIGRLRDECLNEHLFRGLGEARRLIEAWRIDYNLHRPHTSLGGLTPGEFASQSRSDHTMNRANF